MASSVRVTRTLGRMRSSTAVGPVRALGLLGAFLCLSLVSGLLFAGLFLPAVGATGSLTRTGVDFFNNLPSEVSAPPLPEQSVLYAKDGKTVIARFFQENRQVVPLSKIAPVMQKAIIAIEDSRFYEHGGVDPKGLLRAAVNNQLSDDGRVQGASTLTQQYIKNLFLEAAVLRGDKQGIEDATKKDNLRKIKEVKYAVSLEKTKKKEDILAGYLNIANFGDASYGVEAAAQHFFSTSAAKLTLVQAATLAGLVQEPTRFNPLLHPKEARDRRNVVLSRMHDLGMIDDKTFAAAKALKLVTKPKVAANGCIAARDAAFFCSYVKRLIEVDSRFSKLGGSEAERAGAIQRGGLAIVSTLDPKLQKVAFQAVTSKVPVADSSRVASAAVTVDPTTGAVLAMAQNKIFSPKEKQAGRTELNYAVDAEYGGATGFQTGSTFKAFTLAEWLRSGKQLNDVVNASPTSRPVSSFRQCGNDRLRSTEIYRYNNSEKNETGPRTVFESTYNSVNTAYVAMESQLELCKIAKTAAALGVHKSAPAKSECGGDEVTTEIPDCIPSMTLGPFSISPLTMASAYGVFANNGELCPPDPIKQIRDRSNKPVTFTRPGCKQAIEKDVANGVTYALEKVLTSGTAARVGPLPWPSAGKTGTTDNSVDTWFAGYTAQRSTAVWVGDDPNVRTGSNRRSLTGRRIGGQQYSGVFGATIAAPIWKRIMLTAQKGQPKVGWDNPPGDMIGRAPLPPDDGGDGGDPGDGSQPGNLPPLVGQPIGTAFALAIGAGFQARLGRPVPSTVPAGFVAAAEVRGNTVIIHPSAAGRR